MADEQAEQPKGQPAEKPKKPLTDFIVERWSNDIAIPAAAGGIGYGAHHLLSWAGSIPAAASALGFTLEQHVKKDGKPDITTTKILKETITGSAAGAGIYGGLQATSAITKSLGLESSVSSAFGSLGNVGVGTATFGLLSLGLPLIYYPVSHILKEGKMEGMLKDLGKNYFKHPIMKTTLNTMASVAAMDAYSGYTWASYLANAATPYFTSLSSVLAPYLAASPALLLGMGVGIGALGLAMAYRLAFSRENISYGKLALSPFVGTFNLGVGVFKTGYELAKGSLYRGIKLVNDTFKAVQDLGMATHMAMIGVVPAPAKK